MLISIAVFELKCTLKRPLFWLVMLILFALSFGAMISDSVQIGGAIGNVHRNSPFVIFQFHLILSIIALFITTTFVGSTALRADAAAKRNSRVRQKRTQARCRHDPFPCLLARSK